MAVNCASLVTGLVESQFFGHSKGAFTGAESDRAGLFEAAQGGTLFLDEVAELSESAQATLLRVLEEHQVLPVGGSRVRAVDARMLAATLQDIDGLVASGVSRRHARYSAMIGR